MKRRYNSTINRLRRQRNRDLRQYTATLQEMQQQIDDLRALNPPVAVGRPRRVRILLSDSEDEEN